MNKARVALDSVRVEQETQRIGRELFQRVQDEGQAAAWRAERWTGQLLEWSMRHEDARLQLFRFVDVLPALQESSDVVDHLREYFAGRPDPFGGLLKAGLGVGSVGSLGAHVVAAGLRRGVQQVARSFIAGERTAEVLRVVERFHRQKLGFTIDVLGEATLSEREADIYQQRYVELLEALADRAPRWPEVSQVDTAPWGPLPRANLSVKLSALYSQLDPIDPEGRSRPVIRRLMPILQMARERGAHVQIDMEDVDLKDLTFRIFQEVADHPDLRDYRYVGVVLQGYLQEAEADARALVGWARNRPAPVNVRLVKGAYWDQETVRARLEGWPVPVYEEKWQTDASFERLTAYFLQHADTIDLAIGSHNIRSIAHTLAVAQELDLPPRTVEFQFLYGMAEPLRQALVDMGQRVRVYTPFGELIPGMAYLVRRLLENTSNESFLRRGFAENESPAVLLRQPAAAPPRDGGVPEPDAGPDTAMVGTAAGDTNKTGSQKQTAIGGNGVTSLEPFRNEPPRDFSREEARRSMATALERVKAALGETRPLLLGDDLVDTEARIESVNPSRPGEIVGSCASAGEAEADRAVDIALQAFPAWRDIGARHRSEILLEAAAEMRRARMDLAALACLEAGKPWREADGDVCEAIDFMEYYARQVLQFAEPQQMMPHLVGEINHYLYEPRGVAAVIAPWNFPLAILTGMTSAALVAGNAVVMKPAEQTPIIAWRLVEILRKAGVPAGAINYLPGLGKPAGGTLVHHPDVHIIAFTGSRVVGLDILRAAAEIRPGQRHIKQVVTEMGGKNALIVDADADLDEAVAGTVASAFGYAGQKCSACSRVLVLEPIYEQFLERLVEAGRSLIMGPADDPGTFVGPVIEAEARDRIAAYIEQGHGEGRPLLSGEVPQHLADLQGYYVHPAIFADVAREATIACEEIFGPVLSVIRTKDLDEAIDIATDSDYALTGGIFSRSPAHIQAARNRVRVGNFYVNRGITGSLVGRQPFGGLGLSGTGFQAGGPDYLKQFVHTRVITENTLRRGFAAEIGD